MRARGGHHHISSVFGFIPQPYMAAYAASKHAVEGYSESLATSPRARRPVLLVEPANTNTGFDANSGRPTSRCRLCPAAAHLRRHDGGVDQGGDDPRHRRQVDRHTAATDPKPKRATPPPKSLTVSTLRRIVPARVLRQTDPQAHRLAS